MTLAIPLQILVRVHDDPASVSIASLAVEGAVEGDRPADSAVMTAIALARQNRNLPPHEYYDDQADSADRTAYYEHIDGGAGPAALYSALSVLVTDTHRTKLEYSPSTQLYPEVDIQPDGTILSVYSSRQMDPVDLIRADAEIDRARRAALRVLAESQTLSIDDVALFTNRIEAAFPYNCEHVVPQSWFAKRHPMKGDLHHLFACEVKCNEFRANTPYFDFTPDGNPRAGCGRSEPGRFEPVGGKGAVARATLYFLLRYPGEIDNNSREYTRERLGVLLNWHREKPVSLHERHRNRAIQRKQATAIRSSIIPSGQSASTGHEACAEGAMTELNSEEDGEPGADWWEDVGSLELIQTSRGRARARLGYISTRVPRQDQQVTAIAPELSAT